MVNEKSFLEFVEIVSKLEPVEYCGLCKVLCVEMFDGETPKPFDKTLEECMDKFLGMNRKPRRQLMKVLRDATKKSKKSEISNTNTAPATLMELKELKHTSKAPAPSMTSMGEASVRAETTPRASNIKLEKKELV